jgi:hypothetical protein
MSLTPASSLISANIAKFAWPADQLALSCFLLFDRLGFITRLFDCIGSELGGFLCLRLARWPIALTYGKRQAHQVTDSLGPGVSAFLPRNPLVKARKLGWLQANAD